MNGEKMSIYQPPYTITLLPINRKPLETGRCGKMNSKKEALE